MAASRSAQNLEQAAIPPVDAASASVPAVVDLDAQRFAPFPVIRPRLAREVVPEREPTFDELLHGGAGAHATTAGSAGRGQLRWFRRHRPARASVRTRR